MFYLIIGRSIKAWFLTIFVTAVIMTSATFAIQADGPPWPTPPPAPVLGPAAEVPEALSTPVPKLLLPGFVSQMIRPLPISNLPRIPPLPETVFSSEEANIQERIKLHIEAGSTRQAFTLIYEPVTLGITPETKQSLELGRSFRLDAYNYQGKSFKPLIHRPWLLEIPLSPVDNPEPDSSRLLIARFHSQQGLWRPLITSYYPTRQMLTAQILEPGLFAVVKDNPPFK